MRQTNLLKTLRKMEIRKPRSRMPSPGEKLRKPYEPPAVRRRTPEQSKLLLLGHAWNGNQGAKDLLEVLFPEPSQTNPPESS